MPRQGRVTYAAIAAVFLAIGSTLAADDGAIGWFGWVLTAASAVLVVRAVRLDVRLRDDELLIFGLLRTRRIEIGRQSSASVETGDFGSGVCLRVVADGRTLRDGSVVFVSPRERAALDEVVNALAERSRVRG